MAADGSLWESFRALRKGWKDFFTDSASEPYEKWRKLRKASQMLLAPSVVKTYQPLQDGESTQLAFDLLETPERFFDHISRYGNSLVLAILYGRRSPRIETPTALAIVEIPNH
ncbi:hypothetical protein FB107DRAFT_276725 [Schizophyllum commune]